MYEGGKVMGGNKGDFEDGVGGEVKEKVGV